MRPIHMLSQILRFPIRKCSFKTSKLLFLGVSWNQEDIFDDFGSVALLKSYFYFSSIFNIWKENYSFNTYVFYIKFANCTMKAFNFFLPKFCEFPAEFNQKRCFEGHVSSTQIRFFFLQNLSCCSIENDDKFAVKSIEKVFPAFQNVFF